MSTLSILYLLGFIAMFIITSQQLEVGDPNLSLFESIVGCFLSAVFGLAWPAILITIVVFIGPAMLLRKLY